MPLARHSWIVLVLMALCVYLRMFFFLHSRSESWVINANDSLSLQSLLMDLDLFGNVFRQFPEWVRNDNPMAKHCIKMYSLLENCIFFQQQKYEYLLELEWKKSNPREKHINIVVSSEIPECTSILARDWRVMTMHLLPEYNAMVFMPLHPSYLFFDFFLSTISLFVSMCTLCTKY